LIKRVIDYFCRICHFLTKFISVDSCQYQLFKHFKCFPLKRSIVENIELDFGNVRNGMRLMGTFKFKGDSLVANCWFFVNLQQYFLKKREA